MFIQVNYHWRGKFDHSSMMYCDTSYLSWYKSMSDPELGNMRVEKYRKVMPFSNGEPLEWAWTS